MTASATLPPPFPTFAPEDDAPEFELFTGGGRGAHFANKEPTMTIYREGRLMLNTAACLLLGEPEHLELLIDPKRHFIGLRACAGNSPHARKVSRSGRDKRRNSVSARPLLVAYDLLPSKPRQASATLYGNVLAARFPPETEEGGAA